MPEERSPLNSHARDRADPSAAGAVAATGGIGVAAGVLLISIHLYAHGDGRIAGAALFFALLAAGYAALWLAPRSTHAAAVTAVVIGVPGTLGWWLLPHAHSFADVRPFLILSIVAWGALWLAPRTRGRAIFIGAAVLVLWLWMLGEVAGNDSYSAAPVPSPPPHTLFSLSAVTHHVTRPAQVSISSLDPSSPLYSLAQNCDFGDAAACDTLYARATPGSDFSAFADDCAGREPSGSGGDCATLEQGSLTSPLIGSQPFPNLDPLPSVGGSTDKSFEIGIVSLLFGIAYLAAVALLDRNRWRGLATAFVVPGVLALISGAESLGNATHHAWAGGIFVLVAGIDLALLGDFTGRRFTTWAGGFFAALGAVTVALDASNISDSISSEQVKLLGPGLTVIAFSAGLIGLAWVIASVRARYPGTAGGPGTASPWPPAPPPFGAPPAAQAPQATPGPPAPPAPYRPPFES